MKYTVILSPTDSREIKIEFMTAGRKWKESEIVKSFEIPNESGVSLSEMVGKEDLIMAIAVCAPLLSCATGENIPEVSDMLNMYHEDLNAWYEAFLKVNPREQSEPKKLTGTEKKKDKN